MSSKFFTVRSVLFSITVALITVIMFDHAMRVDQENLCQKYNDLNCPTGLWIWSNL